MMPCRRAMAAHGSPKSDRRRCLVAASCLAPLAAFGAQLPASGASIEWPALKLLDGKTLPAQAWRDSAAVVVFFSVYCAYCMRHNAHIDKLHGMIGTRPVRILGAAIDRDAEAVRRYVAVNRYRFPTVADAAALRERFTPRRVVPMTCVVDRAGRLMQAIPGEMAEADVLELADKVLAER